MLILAVESERELLDRIVDIAKDTMPDAIVTGVPFTKEAYKVAANRKVDLAIIDMDMGEDESLGLKLAEKIRDISRDTGIVFMAGNEERAIDAFRIHADGFILKPLDDRKLKEELEHFKESREGDKRKHDLRIRCFGNFEIFIDGTPARFKYQKTKEMLAYLIDRRGAMCGNGELITLLWEEADASRRTSYLKNLKTDLQRVFDEAGYGDSIIKQRGMIGIRTEDINCDYFELLRERDNVLGIYWGEYMNQYSWSEVTHAYLETFYYAKTQLRVND